MNKQQIKEIISTKLSNNHSSKNSDLGYLADALNGIMETIESIDGGGSSESGDSGILMLPYGETIDLEALMAAIVSDTLVVCKYGSEQDGYIYLPLVMFASGILFIAPASMQGQAALYVASYNPSNLSPWSLTPVYLGTGTLVTSISAQSTDDQYPSAKCMYTAIGNIESALETIIGDSPQEI